MGVTDLQSWADNLELVRLPAITSDISDLTAAQAIYAGELDTKTQQLSDRLDVHRVDIDKAQTDATGSITASNQALSSIYQVDTDATTYTNQKFQEALNEINARFDQLNLYLDGDYSLFVDSKIDGEKVTFQQAVDAAVGQAIEARNYLNTNLADMDAVNDDIINNQIPSISQQIQTVDNNFQDTKLQIDSVFAGFEHPSVTSGFDSLRERAIKDITGIRHFSLKLPASLWTNNSTSLLVGSKPPALETNFLTDDSEFGDCYQFDLGADQTIGLSEPTTYEPNKVYLITARYRVVDDGTTSGVEAAIGVTTWSGVTLAAQNVEKDITAAPVTVADGTQTVELYFSDNLTKLQDAGLSVGTGPNNNAVHVGSTGSPKRAFFHFRQNPGLLTNGQIRLDYISIEDANEAFNVKEILDEARTDANAEIATSITDLRNVLEDPFGTSVGATLRTKISTVQAQINDLTNLPAWDATSTYAVDDQVTYNGAMYVALQTSTNNEPPDVTYWNKVGDYASLGDAVIANNTSIIDEQVARSEADQALAQDITTVKAEIEDPLGNSLGATVEQNYVAITGPTGAIATSVDNLKTEIENPNGVSVGASLASEAITRSEEDNALAGQITDTKAEIEDPLGNSLGATVEQNHLSIVGPNGAIATARESLKTEIEDPLGNSVGAEIKSEATTRSEEDEALSTKIDETKADIEDPNGTSLGATVESNHNALVGPTGAIATSVDNLKTEIEDPNGTSVGASIKSEATTRSEEDAALAGEITTLESTLRSETIELTSDPSLARGADKIISVPAGVTFEANTDPGSSGLDLVAVGDSRLRFKDLIPVDRTRRIRVTGRVKLDAEAVTANLHVGFKSLLADGSPVPNTPAWNGGVFVNPNSYIAHGGNVAFVADTWVEVSGEIDMANLRQDAVYIERLAFLNFQGSATAVSRLSFLNIEDITESSKISATLEQDFYTRVDADTAMGVKDEALKSVIEDANGTSLGATVSENFQTITGPNGSIATATEELKAEIENPIGDSLGATVENNYDAIVNPTTGAIAAATESLKTEIENPNGNSVGAEIESEKQTRSDNDDAIAFDVSTISAKISRSIPNGNWDFSNGLEGWTGSTPAILAGDQYSGGQAVNFVGNRNLIWGTKIPIDRNRTYRVKFRVKATGAGPSRIYAGVRTYDSNGVLETTAPGSQRYCATRNEYVPADGQWHTYEGIITGGGNTTHNEFRPTSAFCAPMCLANYQQDNTFVLEVDDLSIEDVTEVETVAASVTQTQESVATLEGYAASTYSLGVVAGEASAGLQIVASDGPDTVADSTLRFYADNILFDGSVLVEHLSAEVFNADLINAGQMSVNRLVVDDVLAIDSSNAGFTMNKLGAYDEQADGVFMGRTVEPDGSTGFGFAASKTPFAEPQQSLSLTERSGLKLLNGNYFKTEASPSGNTTSYTSDQTVSLSAGTTTFSIAMIGGGSGGGAYEHKQSVFGTSPGGNTTVELLDGTTVIETWTASGADGAPDGSWRKETWYAPDGENTRYGPGGAGGGKMGFNLPIDGGNGIGAGSGGGAGGHNYGTWRHPYGGKAGDFLQIPDIRLDSYGLSDPKLRITIGQGSLGSSYASTLTGDGGDGANGLVEVIENDIIELRADVIPLEPTFSGSFPANGGFPDHGAGLWILATTVNHGLALDNLSISDSGELLRIWDTHNASFVSSKTPVVGNAHDARTIKYHFHKMGP